MSPLKDLPISNNKQQAGGESSADSMVNGLWKRFKESTTRALSRCNKCDAETNKVAGVSDGVEETSRDDGGDVELGGNGVEETSPDDEGDVELGRNGFEKTFRDEGDVELGGNGVEETSRDDRDVELGRNGSGTLEANHGKSYRSKLLVYLKRSFYILNFMLVLLVLVLDLISPENNSTYDLVGVVVSSVTLIFAIIEVVCRAKQDEVKWRKKKRVKINWFYDKNGVPFGISADIIGLVCSCLEFIMETVTRFSKDKFKDKPIYSKFAPVVLAFFLFVTTCLKEICAD